jgi:glycosyltransferase involved in cell wall biosynthesis
VWWCRYVCSSGENALLADPGDIDSLAYAVVCLLQDEKARDFLAQKGRETALRFNINNMIDLWEDYLRRVVTIHKRDSFIIPQKR